MEDIDSVQTQSAAQSIVPEQADSQQVAEAGIAASDPIEWSVLAYQLGLKGLAQEIAINSMVESYDQNHLCLKLQPEILELANGEIKHEMTQAIVSKLGVSLKLELRAQDQLEVETPQQARMREQEEQRLTAIDAIRQEDIVQKLHQAFGTELDESSVKKVEAP